MPPVPARDRFLTLLHSAIKDGSLAKLTLGKHRGADVTLKNIFVRPVTLRIGPQLSFVFRHTTKDITKNYSPDEALPLIQSLIGRDFLDAHLFTPAQTVQLACTPGGTSRLTNKAATAAPMPPPEAHDRTRDYLVPVDAPWLLALGVTNERSQPREGMAAKFRQINKFVELLTHLATEAALLPSDFHPSTFNLQLSATPLRVADMGSGKGYLTFATAAHFGPAATVTGFESRPELVELCNRIARENELTSLTFKAGDIADAVLERLDVLIALHACDTATDDALAKGIAAGARLIVVSPCCQKELRSQLTAPPILADALQHGIFQERQAEFVTDALRAQLLEWAGYKTKVFEFVSTEHTAKNLMIAAIKTRPPGGETAAEKLRAFTQFYGVHTQRLAQHLNINLRSKR